MAQKKGQAASGTQRKTTGRNNAAVATNSAAETKKPTRKTKAKSKQEVHDDNDNGGNVNDHDQNDENNAYASEIEVNTTGRATATTRAPPRRATANAANGTANSTARTNATNAQDTTHNARAMATNDNAAQNNVKNATAGPSNQVTNTNDEEDDSQNQMMADRFTMGRLLRSVSNVLVGVDALRARPAAPAPAATAAPPSLFDFRYANIHGGLFVQNLGAEEGTAAVRYALGGQTQAASQVLALPNGTQNGAPPPPGGVNGQSAFAGEQGGGTNDDNGDEDAPSGHGQGVTRNGHAPGDHNDANTNGHEEEDLYGATDDETNVNANDEKTGEKHKGTGLYGNGYFLADPRAAEDNTEPLPKVRNRRMPDRFGDNAAQDRYQLGLRTAQHQSPRGSIQSRGTSLPVSGATTGLQQPPVVPGVEPAQPPSRAGSVLDPSAPSKKRKMSSSSPAPTVQGGAEEKEDSESDSEDILLPAPPKRQKGGGGEDAGKEDSVMGMLD